MLDLLEALLFCQDQAIAVTQVAEWLGVDAITAQTQLHALTQALDERGSGLTVQWVAGGVRLVTHPRLAADVMKRLRTALPEPLSHASWEVLAIVAYRQPITRLEVEAIRQIGSERAIETLISRDLIEEVGRKETPGRPILYGTTRRFLTQFGIPSVDALPPLSQRSDSLT